MLVRVADSRGKMAGKLLALLAGGKAATVSAILVVTGTAVTLGAGIGAPAGAADDDVPVSVTLPVVLPHAADAATPIPRRERVEPPATPAVSCDEPPAIRGEARTTIQSAYVVYHAAIERLQADGRGPRYGETLSGADAMLRRIADTADRAIVDLSPCADVLVDQVAERATAAMETVVNVTAGATTATPPPREKAKATEKPKSKAAKGVVASQKRR